MKVHTRRAACMLWRKKGLGGVCRTMKDSVRGGGGR